MVGDGISSHSCWSAGSNGNLELNFPRKNTAFHVECQLLKGSVPCLTTLARTPAAQRRRVPTGAVAVAGRARDLGPPLGAGSLPLRVSPAPGRSGGHRPRGGEEAQCHSRGRESPPLAEARGDPDEHGAAGSPRARALPGTARVRSRGVLLGTRGRERARGSYRERGKSGAALAYSESYARERHGRRNRSFSPVLSGVPCSGKNGRHSL